MRDKSIHIPSKNISIPRKSISIPSKSISIPRKSILTHLEEAGGVETSAGDRGHLAPVRPVPRVRHPHVHHLRWIRW